MDSFMVVLWLIFSLTLIWSLSSVRRSKKLPPGPASLPIIGNLHLLGDQPHKSLAKLAKTHGPIMTLKLGQITTVVVSSSGVAKEVLQKKDLEFSGRSIPDSIQAHNHSEYSVVWLPVASNWRSLRRIMNSYIFSTRKLDAGQRIRSRKVQELIDYCKKNCQTREAVDIGQAAFSTSLNLLSNVIISRDFADPLTDSAKDFKELVGKMTVEAGRPNVVDFFPVLKRFDPQGVRGRMTILMGKTFDRFKAMITERLESGKSGGATIGFLDDLLTLSEETPEEMDINQIVHIFLDLFGAGTDTTASTLEWAMAEMLKNPATLKKARAELAEATGRGKQIEETDLPHLPYLQCVMKETLRMHPPAPLLIPRKVERDVEVCGYVVPGGSQVLVNAWAIGRDEKVWEEPLVFKPERFFDTGIDFRGRDFELIPFGAGRRICPGISLVGRTIPVVLGSLLNMFDWKLEGDIAPEELNMEEKFGITLQKAQPLRAVPVAF